MKTVSALGTSFSRPLGSVTARLAQTPAATIPGITSAASDRDGQPVSLQLAKGKVHRVDRADGIREIQVLRGTLWLTTTPADGDVLLRSGERFPLSTARPVIFEAVDDAAIVLARR